MQSTYSQNDQFLQYEYSAHHMKLDDECRCHCYCFALNTQSENYEENHNNSIYRQCLQGFHLFKETDRFLQHISQKLDVPEENEETQKLKNEIVSMKKASKEILEPTIKSYMSHRVGAIAQFAKLSKETSSFTNTRCGLWLDHKQKILAQRSREGQIEYFAKRGMSLLGFYVGKKNNE